MKRLWTLLTVLTLLATMTGSAIATAQSTPGNNAIDPAVRGHLAAIIPDKDSLPVGYTFVGESFINASEITESDDDASMLTDAGFIMMYVSIYEDSDTDTRIRSWVSAWTDNDAAIAGHDGLEGTDQKSDFSTEEVDIGEEPRERASGTYETSSGTEMTAQSISFRSDNRLIGVAVETPSGEMPDADLVTDLATQLAERDAAVSEGNAPAYTDPDLPTRALMLGEAGDELQAGFLGPKEVEEIYGVQGTILSNLQTSWVETILLGSSDNFRTITVGITTFDDANDTREAVNQASDIFAPLTDQQEIDDATVEGADAVKAYRYSSSTSETDALNSYRIIFAIDTDLMVVDVQDAPSDDVASSTAMDFAKSQAECASGDICSIPDVSGMTGE